MRALFALLLLAATPVFADTWYESYEKGVRLIAEGKAGDARTSLEKAVAQRAQEGLQLPARPQQYLDYLPHLYLAIANQMTGDVDAARKELVLAERSGVAVRSEIGRPLLVAYQLLLRGDQPSFKAFASTKPVLSDDEFQTLRNDVLSKCDLPLNTPLKNAPWYANYELGIELERKGDYPRALTHFIDAVATRPNPQKQARMYGMWLIDYYPYFHIARSHVRLGNWACAKNALEISERLDEVPQGTPELAELLSLERETEQKLTKN
jgi:hypothetical protein